MVLVVSLIFNIRGFNKNNKQFAKMLSVGHTTPDRSFLRKVPFPEKTTDGYLELPSYKLRTRIVKM